MAVVQISRIQIRRGQKNQGTGLPQLASGELAWAIDTQELYIGNGSVNEGSPAVGNTKIITQKDNLLDLANVYRYKRTNPLIVTHPTTPVVRNLEDRLNDKVSNLAYGILPNGEDMTAELQNAIDNLFITNRASGESSRVTLEFLPGRYIVSSTIFVPSYVSIIGAGQDKTIFEYIGTSGPVFRFINDTSTITIRNYTVDGSGEVTNPYTDSGTFIQQPKFIHLQGFTIKVNNTDIGCFRLDSVRDSEFKDIEVRGNFDWYEGADSTTVASLTPDQIAARSAFNLNSFSSLVTCKNNKFENIRVSRYIAAVVSKYDIINNTWSDCEFKESRYGFRFGEGTSTIFVGQRFGPRRNIIKHCYFNDIKEEGIYIQKGYGNLSNNNVFIDVGNDGSGNAVTANGTSIIRFISKGNVSNNDVFDRAYNSVDNGTSTPTENGLSTSTLPYYYPEVEGPSYLQANISNVLTINANSSGTLFRIPYSSDSNITIPYVLQYDHSSTQMRRGNLYLAIDFNNETVMCTDEYDYIGDILDSLKISFTATLDTVRNSVNINYDNDNTTYNTIFSYVYNTLTNGN